MIISARDGLDWHAENAVGEGTVGSEHAGGIIRVGASQIFHPITGAIVIGVRIGIDPKMAEVLHFPSIREAVAVGVRDDGRWHGIKHLDQARMVESRAAQGGESGKGFADGRVIEGRAAG